MSDTLKTCLTCHWRRTEFTEQRWQYWKCSAPENKSQSPNPVTGERDQRQYTYCEEMRKFGDCGPDGKLWQARLEDEPVKEVTDDAAGDAYLSEARTT